MTTTGNTGQNNPDSLSPNSVMENRAFLQKLAGAVMPFGKYKGTRLVDLPEPYVVWFSQKGFPKGELGTMLQLVYEIKVNGLEYLFKNITPSTKPNTVRKKYRKI